MSKKTILQAPELKHDAMMANRFGTKISANGRLERRIAWNLLKHLEAAGWTAGWLDDGDEVNGLGEEADPALAAMELLFNLDEARIEFFKGQRVKGESRSHHAVLLVLGNDIDIITDWSFSKDDGDGFNAAMEAFDAEQFA